MNSDKKNEGVTLHFTFAWTGFSALTCILGTILVSTNQLHTFFIYKNVKRKNSPPTLPPKILLDLYLVICLDLNGFTDLHVLL